MVLGQVRQTVCLSSSFGRLIIRCIVITGATDGIGKEFASQLAKSGFGVILVSRSETRLKAVAEELGMFSSIIASMVLFGVRIESKLSAKTKLVTIDFSHPKESDYDALAHTCKDLDVSVLSSSLFSLAGCSIEWY